jgi:hypothetical protein
VVELAGLLPLETVMLLCELIQLRYFKILL